MTRRIDGTPEERLLARVEKHADGCWVWTGWVNEEGYGRINVGNQMPYVHRLAYELWVGPIPTGLAIDHLCRVRRCCNPLHLEPVTVAENNRRIALHRTHCKRGHEFTPENTIVNSCSGLRQCRACENAAQRERYWRRKAAQSTAQINAPAGA